MFFLSSRSSVAYKFEKNKVEKLFASRQISTLYMHKIFILFQQSEDISLYQNDTGLKRRPISILKWPESIFDGAFFIEC